MCLYTNALCSNFQPLLIRRWFTLWLMAPRLWTMSESSYSFLTSLPVKLKHFEDKISRWNFEAQHCVMTFKEVVKPLNRLAATTVAADFELQFSTHCNLTKFNKTKRHSKPTSTQTMRVSGMTVKLSYLSHRIEVIELEIKPISQIWTWNFLLGLWNFR